MLTNEQIFAHWKKKPVRQHHGADVFECRLFDLLDFARAIEQEVRQQTGIPEVLDALERVDAAIAKATQ